MGVSINNAPAGVAGRKGKMDAPALTAEERRHLADLYDALLGVVCENGEEFFDGYHRRGGRGLMRELAGICGKLAPAEFAEVANAMTERSADS